MHYAFIFQDLSKSAKTGLIHVIPCNNIAERAHFIIYGMQGVYGVLFLTAPPPRLPQGDGRVLVLPPPRPRYLREMGAFSSSHTPLN